MNTNQKILSFLGVVIIIGILWGFAHRNTSPLAGAVTNQCASGQTCLPSFEFTGAIGSATNTLQIDAGNFANAGTFSLGASGTTQSQQISTTCSLIGPVSQAASTTVAYDCAVAGVQAGDRINAQFASSTQAFGAWLITTARASTTANFVTLGVVNNTGIAATPNFGSVGSTTIWAVR